MNHRLLVLVLLLVAGALHAPLLADDAADADASPPAAETVDADEDAGETPREARPSSDDFRPTERLRWDQEVDFPTDI